MKIVKARTLNELVASVYRKEGWTERPNENAFRRVNAIYGIAPDYETNYYVAIKGGK